MEDPAAPDPPPGALHAPHTLRNRGPILDVLIRALADKKAVLEIACGSGEQAPFFAGALAHLTWQSSDIEATAVASATAWAQRDGPGNMRAPIRLDVTARPWALPDGFAPDAIVAINMIHISPYSACEGLMAGAGEILPAGGVVYLYGPYKIDGAHTSPSNAMFDQSLHARDPGWGIRDIDQVIATAAAHGLAHAETVPMPANNFSVLFRKT